MILNIMIKIKKFKSKILFKINKLIKEVLKKKTNPFDEIKNKL